MQTKLQKVGQHNKEIPANQSAFSLHDRIENLRHRLGRAEPVLVFGAGFFYDVLTLGRIDSGRTLAMNGLYLVCAGGLVLWLMVSPPASDIAESADREGHKAVLWLRRYRNNALHFFLGALLNAFAIFYFKSASFANAFFLLLIMGTLLVANETRLLRDRGPIVKLLLWNLSLVSYCLIVVPLALQQSGPQVFAGSMAASGLVSGLIALAVARICDRRKGITLALTTAAVMAGFSALYFLRVIPPVPLSLVYAGMYHRVEKQADGYHLSRQTPTWKFWSRGDQHYFFRAPEPVYFFAQIFAPGGFHEKVWICFELNNNKGGWQQTDRIPLTVAGGRREGYRAYALKRHYQEGKWRARVETSAGLEIGRLAFELIPDRGRPIPYFDEIR